MKDTLDSLKQFQDNGLLNEIETTSGTASILKNTLNDMLGILPNLIGAIIVLILGYIIAKVLSFVIKKVIVVSGLDKLADQFNKLDVIAQSGTKILPSAVIPQIIYYLLLLVFMIASADVLGVDIVSEQLGKFMNYVPKLFTAVVIMIFGIVVASFIKSIVETACRSLNIPTYKLISNLLFYYILIIVVISAMKQAELETNLLSTNITIVIGGLVLTFALGYGIASRHLMSNMLSSFYSKDKFHLGDVIRVSGVAGEIVDMDSNSITLQGKGRRHVLPMSALTSQQVEIFDDISDLNLPVNGDNPRLK